MIHVCTFIGLLLLEGDEWLKLLQFINFRNHDVAAALKTITNTCDKKYKKLQKRLVHVMFLDS